MQNPIQKFRQNSNFWETRYFVWKFEKFEKISIYLTVQYFFAERTGFLLINVYKSMCGVL